MSAPTANARADERRHEIAARIASHLLAEGLEAASLRPIAKAAGLSDRMLIYYFGTRDAAIAAALEVAASQLRMRLMDATAPAALPAEVLVERLAGFILSPGQAPVMTLWFEIAARAARGVEPYRTVAPVIAQGFLDWVREQLDPGEADRDAKALGILAQLDGLALLHAAGVDLADR